MGHPRVIPVAVLAAFVATATAQAQDISIQLLFDGQPIHTTARPAFSCFDELRQQWVACTISAEPAADGGYVLAPPAPGRYTLHVEIDENAGNPGRFPGDYDVFQSVDIAQDTSVLRVDMKKVMRLTSPWDNNTDLDAMLTQAWSDMPAVETPRGSTSHVATVTFKWMPVVPGAVYHYVVVSSRNSPYERGPEVVQGTTRATRVTLRLPRSASGRYFAFGVTADKNGRPVGELLTHGAGAQGWTYNFIVRDRSRAPKNGTVVATYQPHVDEPAGVRNARLLAEWTQAIPKPSWWNDVPPTPLRINSLGDLRSIWQSGTSDAARRQRFYKLAYQAILDHPGDDDLVSNAIDLMAAVADRDERLPLLEFGVSHFFSYNQRTDNCVHCKIGDEAGQMVRDLAEAYIERGEYQQAIDVIQRFVKERDTDVSDYNLALTFGTMADAYWRMKDPDAAKAALREGLRRFSDGWQADQLRRTLANYERATAAPTAAP